LYVVSVGQLGVISHKSVVVFNVVPEGQVGVVSAKALIDEL